MIIYLSLRQIILNQIAVLIRKQSDKSNDDPERLLRRLNYLQQALEQIKSYQHNSNYQYVIKHFDIELTDDEQRKIRELAHRFDDTGDASKREKSGFTTQRSETLFTGAAEDIVSKFYGSDPEDDEKHPSKHKKKPPQWITYRGFAHWLRKQSFIKFKKRNDQDKYKKIWSTILGLKMKEQWQKKRINKDNIIGHNGTQPYIAIEKCGTREIVKATLLRLSITQNRIFKFNIDESEINARTLNTRARGSIDLDNEDIAASQSRNNALNANQLIQGRNLFDEVTNKDVLRIVATMLWDTNLANNVLEELLHNPRFSMYGIHAKNIADRIAKEMDLSTMSSYEPEKSPSASADAQQQQIQTNTGTVEQFSIPSPSRKPNHGTTENKPGQVYNPQYAKQNNYNHNQPHYAQKKQSQNYKHNEPQSVAEHEDHHHPQHASPSPNIVSPDMEPVKPHHRPQSASVVMHDNIRDSEIHDYGAQNEYDSDQQNEYGDDEDESESPASQHDEPVNDNIGFGRRKSVDHEETNEEHKTDPIESKNDNNTFEDTDDTKHDHKENETRHESKADPTENATDSKQNEENESKTYIPAGIRRRKTVDQRTSFLKQNFLNLAEVQKWNKLCERLNAVFDPQVSTTFKAYADAEEFDFQAILDDIEEYPDDRDCFDSNLLLYMSDKFDWDKKELDKFYRTIKRVLMDKKSSRRQESLARLLSIGPSTFDVTRDLDIGDKKMDFNQFNRKWSSGLIEALRQYCIQEEYDLDSIAEDLESFEEDCCMIVEELKKQFDWEGTQRETDFVNDLREFITTDPQQATKHLTAAYFDDD